MVASSRIVFIAAPIVIIVLGVCITLIVLIIRALLKYLKSKDVQKK
jgi:hypothetical protein